MTAGTDHQSAIMCPSCGTVKTEAMPADACRLFYECTGCGVMLRPKPGDCCVFCSYGSVPCPPMQAETDHRQDAYQHFRDVGARRSHAVRSIAR